jgi:hypothetical protein
MLKHMEKRRVWLSIITLMLVVALRTTSTQGSTWYVAPTGSNTSGCGASGSPCATVSYALSNKVAAGDTIIVNPGTYTESLLALNASKHQNVTITTTPSVITALGTFTKGIPSGTDNRPYFSAARADISVTGVTLSYLRIRNASARFEGAYDGIVGVSAQNTTIDHMELWNGNQGVAVNVKKLVTISNNYIHTTGSMSGSLDAHGVQVTASSGTAATSYAEAVRITNNTISDIGGDTVQEATAAYGSGNFQYLIIDNNSLNGAREQAFDSKGTSFVKIYGNDIFNNGEGGIVRTWDPPTLTMTNWEIYGNKIHDHKNYAIVSAQAPPQHCLSEKIYNNLIYNNVSNPPWNQAAVDMCGDANSVFYGNTVYNNTSSGTNKTGGVADHGSGSNVKNNIFYNNGLGPNHYGSIRNISGEDAGTPDHNYISGASQKTGTSVIATCYATGNCPGFLNPGAFVFQLLAGSPAKQAGLNLGSPYDVDYAGSARVVPWDLGAYRLGTTSGLSAPTNLRIVR